MNASREKLQFPFYVSTQKIHGKKVFFRILNMLEKFYYDVKTEFYMSRRFNSRKSFCSKKLSFSILFRSFGKNFSRNVSVAIEFSVSKRTFFRVQRNFSVKILLKISYSISTFPDSMNFFSSDYVKKLCFTSLEYQHGEQYEIGTFCLDFFRTFFRLLLEGILFQFLTKTMFRNFVKSFSRMLLKML